MRFVGALLLASLEEYEQEAAALFSALKAGDKGTQWRLKWDHPRFREKSVDDVRAATLDLADARVVVAHEYAFENCAE